MIHKAIVLAVLLVTGIAAAVLLRRYERAREMRAAGVRSGWPVNRILNWTVLVSVFLTPALAVIDGPRTGLKVFGLVFLGVCIAAFTEGFVAGWWERRGK